LNMAFLKGLEINETLDIRRKLPPTMAKKS